MEEQQIFISSSKGESTLFMAIELRKQIELHNPFALQVLSGLNYSYATKKDGYIGWIFEKQFTSEMIQIVFHRLTGIKIEII